MKSVCRRSFGAFAALVVLGFAGSAGAQLPDGDALVCCAVSELSPPCTVASLEDCVASVGAPVPGEICCALSPLADTCTTGSCDTGLPAPCADGAYECVDGTLACVPPSIPEVCDGQDNDCDGETDEGFPIGEACDGPDGDACVEGVTVCDGAGGVACSDSTPDNVETCNGVDDDCDGQVDEGAASSCPVAPNSFPTCSGGNCGLVCSPGFADCNAFQADGCETSLNSTQNCGGCGLACSFNQACVAGNCQ